MGAVDDHLQLRLHLQLQKSVQGNCTRPTMDLLRVRSMRRKHISILEWCARQCAELVARAPPTSHLELGGFLDAFSRTLPRTCAQYRAALTGTVALAQHVRTASAYTRHRQAPAFPRPCRHPPSPPPPAGRTVAPPYSQHLSGCSACPWSRGRSPVTSQP